MPCVALSARGQYQGKTGDYDRGTDSYQNAGLLAQKQGAQYEGEDGLYGAEGGGAGCSHQLDSHIEESEGHGVSHEPQQGEPPVGFEGLLHHLRAVPD